jgi:hypothetical protein
MTRATLPGRDVLVRYRGEVAAMATEYRVLLAPSIAALEPDHPRRRFVATLALVGREMTEQPGAEPYSDEQAAFYARMLLMPNDDFERLCEDLSDAELAEHFNVPLDQVPAKREDIELDL